MTDSEAKKRILVIDDDPVYRELMTIGLSAEGYTVLLAENGMDGKEIVGSEPVDAIVVDMLMPLMDGLRFINWLRGEAKEQVPVLVLTSVDNRALSVEAMVAGATDVLVKPVSLPGLAQKLETLVGS